MAPAARGSHSGARRVGEPLGGRGPGASSGGGGGLSAPRRRRRGDGDRGLGEGTRGRGGAGAAAPWRRRSVQGPRWRRCDCGAGAAVAMVAEVRLRSGGCQGGGCGGGTPARLALTSLWREGPIVGDPGRRSVCVSRQTGAPPCAEGGKGSRAYIWLLDPPCGGGIATRCANRDSVCEWRLGVRLGTRCANRDSVCEWRLGVRLGTRCANRDSVCEKGLGVRLGARCAELAPGIARTCPVFRGCDPCLVFAASGTKALGIRRPKAGWVRGLGWRLSAFVQRLKDGRCRSGAGCAGRRRQRQGDRRPPLPVPQWGRCGALRLRRAEGAGPRGRADAPLSKVPQWQRVRSCAGAAHCSGRASGRPSAQAPPGAARATPIASLKPLPPAAAAQSREGGGRMHAGWRGLCHAAAPPRRTMRKARRRALCAGATPACAARLDEHPEERGRDRLPQRRPEQQAPEAAVQVKRRRTASLGARVCPLNPRPSPRQPAPLVDFLDFQAELRQAFLAETPRGG